MTVLLQQVRLRRRLAAGYDPVRGSRIIVERVNQQRAAA